MTTHELKIQPQFFKRVWDGSKTYEIRYCVDRTFSVDDILQLREWTAAKGYTGRAVGARVTYITDSWDFPEAIRTGYCVMAITVIWASQPGGGATPPRASEKV